MDNSSNGRASFWTQANALLRKNLTFQKRSMKSNIRLIAFPFFLCVLLVIIQTIVNNQLDKPKYKCGCICIDTNGNGSCEKKCGVEYSTLDQVATCPIPSPPEWPAFLQVPELEYRAARTSFIPYTDLPDESCRRTSSCPVTFLFTGGNQSLAESLADNFFTSDVFFNASDYLNTLSILLPGTDTELRSINFIDPAFLSNRPIYIILPQCMSNSSFSIPIKIANRTFQQEVKCVQGLRLWRDSTSVVNDELFKGYRGGNSGRKINEIAAAYDLLNTDANNFNVSIWYNATYNNDSGNNPLGLVRVPRSLNVVGH